MSEGGFTAVAAYLTERFGLDPPMDRRQVYEWNRRRVVNQAGQVFPSPERAEAAASRRPRLIFSFEKVAAWYAAGVPGPHGHGWITPGELTTDGLR